MEKPRVKENSKIPLDRPIISVVISKTGWGGGEESVSRFPAPRHSIFLSGKRYQANCICPLHRGAEPDQTVFVALDITLPLILSVPSTTLPFLFGSRRRPEYFARNREDTHIGTISSGHAKGNQPLANYLLSTIYIYDLFAPMIYSYHSSPKTCGPLTRN